jgi:hypothetical protein
MSSLLSSGVQHKRLDIYLMSCISVSSRGFRQVERQKPRRGVVWVLCNWVMKFQGLYLPTICLVRERTSLSLAFLIDVALTHTAFY